MLQQRLKLGQSLKYILQVSKYKIIILFNNKLLEFVKNSVAQLTYHSLLITTF